MNMIKRKTTNRNYQNIEHNDENNILKFQPKNLTFG